MTFHQMIQALLKADSSITNKEKPQLPPGLIENLDNMGAFRGKPAYRYILSAIMRTGLADKLTDRHAPADEIQTLIDRFISHTGFQPQLVYSLTEAIAYAFGQTNHPTLQQSQFSTKNTTSLTTQDTIRHLNTLLCINRETEAARGVTIINPAITSIIQPTPTTPTAIKLTATLRRTNPQGSASLHYAIYTNNITCRHTEPTSPQLCENCQHNTNEPNPDTSQLILLHTGIADTFTLQSPSPHPISTSIYSDPSAISLILLYLD